MATARKSKVKVLDTKDGKVRIKQDDGSDMANLFEKVCALIQAAQPRVGRR